MRKDAARLCRSVGNMVGKAIERYTPANMQHLYGKRIARHVKLSEKVSTQIAT